MYQNQEGLTEEFNHFLYFGDKKLINFQIYHEISYLREMQSLNSGELSHHKVSKGL
jgi:hypothetical protein